MRAPTLPCWFCVLALPLLAALSGACSACDSPSSKCDGVCVDTQTSPTNCGACGVVCGAGQACRSGECVRVCDAGVPCGDVCIDTQSDVRNCGACGRDCTFSAGERRNVAPACVRGACQYPCAAGFEDCDLNVANGCEADPRSSTEHCGACNRSCSRHNASATVCEEGRCRLICDVGFGNCDHDESNGCEANLFVSNAHCGACDSFCDVADAGRGFGCVSGTCDLACEVGYRECPADAGRRCVDILRDPDHCGGCEERCPSRVCFNGNCVVQ